jgi:Skp family chaperone for outer membrane proteins
MSTPQNRFTLPALAWPALTIVLGVALSYTVAVEASRPMKVMAAPTAVAVVDVSRLVEEIDERGEWDMRIESLRAAVEQEFKNRQAAAERRLEESENASDEITRQTIRDEVALMQLRTQEWAIVKGQELDRERSLKWQSIYRNLRRESARIAETDGYELVLVNDATGEIRTNPASKTPLEQQVLTQMLDRRILFTAEPIDITEQLIVRMNNALPQP